LHPRLPICVGFWDGTTTGLAPNANPLQNSGLIRDLLHLTDNPKGLTLTETQLSGTKSSKVIGPILRIAITVHIRPLGEDSEDKDYNVQLRIKQEDTSSLSKDISLSTNTIQSLSSPKAKQLKAVSVTDKTCSNLPSQNFEHNTASPTGSTTREDTPPPSYLPASALLLSTHVLSPSKSSNRFPERPATPTTTRHTRSNLARKRSLTLLSSQQISIHSTRKPKWKPTTKNTSPSSSSVIDRITESSIIPDASIESDS